MAGRLSGKIAVVTAAGQGIGQAIAEVFAREGAIVHASDLDPAKLASLQGCKCEALDVRSSGAVAAYAEKTGPIDVLVNVAGTVHHGTVLDTSEYELDFTFDLNVKSMHRTIAAFLPGMMARAEANGSAASIINMSSCASAFKGIPNRYAYGTSKGAVIGLTKSVAVDFIARKVRCNAICPGPIKTPSWDERVETFSKEFGDHKRALDVYLSRQPIGRVGEAVEVAALALYLASDESAFMTGVAIPLDGGLTL